MDRDTSWDVTLYLRGPNLEPDAITTALGFAPTRSRQRGRAEWSSSGREVHPKLGIWAWAVQSEDPNLSVHLGQLVERLAGVGDLRALAGVEEAFIDVHLTWTRPSDGDAQTWWSIDAPLLKALAALELPVNWTIDGVAS